jgi:homocysteine S-methyltransferase
VLIATGDLVAFADRKYTTTVRDMNVFDLVGMAREAGLQTGVVLDPHPESNGLDLAVKRLQRKVDAGAQFAVTQPIYDTETADIMVQKTHPLGLPIIMGILPLRTVRHAEFLHHKVAGIAVPKKLRQRMARTEDTIAEGIANTRELLTLSKDRFAGACIMPPFDHYEILFEVLS